jgi:HK97 family phage prohead protease
MLGRLDKGTLSLRVDDKGLFYSVEVPDSETGRQAVADVDCGNLDGASFMFNITGSKWEDVQDGDSWTTYRTITDLDLLECGPVAMPAYTATTSALRAIAEDRVKDALAERDEWRRANRRSEITDVEIRATELALAEMD